MKKENSIWNYYNPRLYLLKLVQYEDEKRHKDDGLNEIKDQIIIKCKEKKRSIWQILKSFLP